MKIFRFRLLPALAFFLFGLNSCKKSDAVEKVTYTSAQIAGSYTLSSIIYTAHDSPTEDFTDTYLENCQQDDVYELNGDMTFNYYDAGEICEPSGDYQSNWTLDENRLEFDFYQMEIEKYDGKILVGSLSETQNGHTHKLTFSFAKQ